jgi:hypothetical protein
VRRRTALSGSREPAPRRRGPDAEDPGRQAGRSRPAARGHRRSRSNKRLWGGGNLVSDHPHRPSEHAPAGDARCSASAPGCSGLTPASGWGSPRSLAGHLAARPGGLPAGWTADLVLPPRPYGPIPSGSPSAEASGHPPVSHHRTAAVRGTLDAGVTDVKGFWRDPQVVHEPFRLSPDHRPLSTG